MEVFTQRLTQAGLTISSLLLDMERMRQQEKNTGLAETHGEPIGENTDSSESRCTKTTMLLSKTVQLVIQLIKKLKMSSQSLNNLAY